MVERLTADERVGQVRPVDLATVPTAADDQDWIVEQVRGCDVVVHCDTWGDAVTPAAERRRRLLHSTTGLLAAAEDLGMRRVVVLSSAAVYGALPGAAVPLSEDAPVLATHDDSLAGDLAVLEALLERSHAEMSVPVTVVRPALIVGPGVDGPLGRVLSTPRVLVVKGARPLWQFCHVDDLATALATAVLDDVDGPLTVGCEGWLTQEEVEHVGGLARLEVPYALAHATADRLHRLGVTRSPAGELAYGMHPWVVSSARLRAAGWRPRHDNVSALQAMLTEQERRRASGSGASPARLGAAGATMAVLGAAAVVRARRRRRR